MSQTTNRVGLCAPNGGGDLNLEVNPDGSFTLCMTFAMDEGATVELPSTELQQLLTFLKEATVLVERKLEKRT